MKTRLFHVRANVGDLQKAVEWYSKMLGFNVENYWPPDRPNSADFASAEGAVFSVKEAEPASSGGQFNFYVDDIDGLWDTLKDRVEVVEKLAETPQGQRKFTIRDPDGNELGFVKGQ